MEIRFLGTGGGRFCLIKQLRQTGGIFLKHKDFRMCVDPGPGALVHGIKNDVQLTELDAVFVSHPHLDHEGDIEAIIEAMTNGATEKRGKLIMNKLLLEPGEDQEQVVGSYHREPVKEIVEAEEGNRHSLNSEMTLEFHETMHKETQTTGFRLEYGEKTLSYIPDSEIFDELSEKFQDTDYLILCCARPHDKSWEGHMSLDEAVKVIREIDPEKTFITHFGANFIYSMEDEREWLEENHRDLNIELAEDNERYRPEGALGDFL